jgi:Raf kinase inhibitor-like YbhB/YbcL family protein
MKNTTRRFVTKSFCVCLIASPPVRQSLVNFHCVDWAAPEWRGPIEHASRPAPLRASASIAGGLQVQTIPHQVILDSPTLMPGQLAPRQHTAQGADLSPALRWRGLPPNTRQIAVALEDRDTHFPNDEVFLQWMVYGIPATAQGLPGGLPETEVLQLPPDIRGAFQARTHYDVAGYRGPEPPVGELHHYRFIVYALDMKLPLGPGLSANTVFEALKGHIIGEGEISVTYRRTP